MEATEIINLWKAYDKKLEENLVLNRQNAKDITRIKVKSFIASMKPVKIFTIVTGILWVVFVDMLIVSLFHVASPYFLISAAIQVLLTKLAIIIYLYQLLLIHRVDISEPILATQEKLSRLQSSTLWVTRLLFLQLPVWTTFYLQTSIFENGNIWLYVLQFGITGIFTYAAIWLFINIRYEHKDKKWFGLIFNGKEWGPILQSMKLLDEISEYKQEPVRL